jgi:hypothetical protein
MKGRITLSGVVALFKRQKASGLKVLEFCKKVISKAKEGV